MYIVVHKVVLRTTYVVCTSSSSMVCGVSRDNTSDNAIMTCCSSYCCTMASEDSQYHLSYIYNSTTSV